MQQQCNNEASFVIRKKNQKLKFEYSCENNNNTSLHKCLQFKPYTVLQV